MENTIYELFVCLLASASVGFVIADLNGLMTETMFLIDGIIYVFFVFEYFFRLIIAKDKRNFIKANIFDLIAIIPFSSAFRVFRTFKFARLLKFTKFAKFAKSLKLLALAGRLFNKAKRFLNTNGFKYMLMLSFAMIVTGGVLISFAEGMSLSDGIWWAFVTATTVGYGDISPASIFGRIIACILMICGIGLIGSLTSTITSFFMKKVDKETFTNNDKIEMVLVLYEELNSSEKEIFKEKIK